jgi:hypothetical protein
MSASEDAIAAAAAGSNVQAATTKARAYAVLATRESTKASDFGRKMLSGGQLSLVTGHDGRLVPEPV